MIAERIPGQSDISRRAVLLGAVAGGSALALGPSLWAGAEAAAAPFIKGADISWMPQMEANGYYWRNSSGVKQDLLTILKGYGISAIRLRTWVNPSNNPVNGHCSISEVATTARRCQDAGMRFLLDFHFGDSWNSVGSQTAPRAWANLSYSQLRTQISAYVSNCMKVLKAKGVTPAWVQLGNETNKGICGSVGSVSNPTQMTGLLMAAHDAVKQSSSTTLTVIHLAQPQKLASIQTFLDRYQSHGGRWDITGLSSYANGSNVPGVLDYMKTIQTTYGKPVMQVEAGGPVGSPGTTKTSLVNMMTGIKAFGGLGSFYWEPEGYVPFTNYNAVAWNSSTRRPTIALDAFKAV